MEPRWHITRNQIAELLETHGIEVRLWEVDHNVFEGAIVDGYRPEQFAQQEDSLAEPCDCPVQGFTVTHLRDCKHYE